MKIIQNGSDFTFRNSAIILDELPIGNYSVHTSMFGPYLTKNDNFKLPEKIYGNDKEFINHILHTWKNSPDSIGILLTGLKGLGKSFTANLICELLGLPIVKVTEPLGREVIDILNDIKQEHVVYIDEFEKLFPIDGDEGKASQEMFLSYLDGNNSSGVKKLFLITTNESINKYFINRPTRLRYVREYNELAPSTIKEIIEDKLQNIEYLDDIIENVDAESVNMDILIKIIDEVNIHNKPYSTFKDFFNFKIEEPTYFSSIEINGIQYHLSHTPDKRMLIQMQKGIASSYDQYYFGYIQVKDIIYSIYANVSMNNKVNEMSKGVYEIPVHVKYDTGGDEDGNGCKEITIDSKVIIEKLSHRMVF